MSLSVGGGETYPGRSFSISQLLFAVKRKLRGTTFAGRVATTMKQAEVDFLEQDVLEVLSLVRSIKNTFTPINQIPPEALALIPFHCDTEGDLITLTHVCRSWREILISQSSLWTSLDCTDVEKTRTYLERSKASPVEIVLEEGTFLDEAFLLTVPHLNRLGALTLEGSSNGLLELTKHFGFPAPLLKKLKLAFTCTETPIVHDTIFGGNLSSLHELRLSGLITSLTWEKMSSLRTFELNQVPGNKVSVTQLLDFFERCPLLRKLILRDAFPNSSDAPPGRVVSLPNLEYLIIDARPVHTILLNHLSIPAGTLMSQDFEFSDEKSPILSYLPKNLNNLKHLSHMTSINLAFGSGVQLRLNGSSGALYMYGTWATGAPSPTTVDRRVLRSLGLFHLPAMEKLAITQYRALPFGKTEKPSVYQTLSPMKNLRHLTLTNCLNLPFVLALNPKKNPSEIVLCPELEEISMHIKRKDWFCINELLAMVEERASVGAKLETITIVCLQEFVPAKEVLTLRAHVAHVEYRLDDVMPCWEEIPGEPDEPGCESDW